MKNTVLALLFGIALSLTTPATFAQNAPLSAGQVPQRSIIHTHYNTTQRLGSGLSLNFDLDIDTLQNEPEFNQLLLNTALRFNAGTHVPGNAIGKFVEFAGQNHLAPNGIINEFFFRTSAKIEPFSRPNLVSALISRYEYTTGAHGEMTFSCINFDISAKKQLFFKDIFKENCKKNLTELLKKHDPRRRAADFEYAKEENEIPAQPHPTENFLLRPDGVLFVYQPYEIDCHATGAIFIRVPADEIAPLLK